MYASPRDPLLKDLCQHRKVTAHEGPLWIKPEKVRDPTEFRFWSGDTPVLDFARKVLALLKKIQNEVHPDSYSAAPASNNALHRSGGRRGFVNSEVVRRRPVNLVVRPLYEVALIVGNKTTEINRFYD